MISFDEEDLKSGKNDNGFVFENLKELGTLKSTFRESSGLQASIVQYPQRENPGGGMAVKKSSRRYQLRLDGPRAQGYLSDEGGMIGSGRNQPGMGEFVMLSDTELEVSPGKPESFSK